MARTILHEDERGYVIVDGNEVTIGSKIDDPPKLRVTAPCYNWGGGGGVISFNYSRRPDVICWGQEQDEVGFVRVEQAESVRGNATNTCAEFNIFLADGSGQGDVERVFAFTTNRFTKWASNCLASLAQWIGGHPVTDTMWANNGMSFTQQQPDGNFATYMTHTAFDKSGAWPVWSAWTGRIE